MKDTVSMDAPDTGVPADSDAGVTARPHPDSHPNDSRLDNLGSPTTEHLRQLWLAGARNITVTYDADVERHRAYLAHPRTDSQGAIPS